MKLSEKIVDDYWTHIELQQDGLVLDWYAAYWRLAMEILPEDYRIYLQNMKSMTPEKLQAIIKDFEEKAPKGKT